MNKITFTKQLNHFHKINDKPNAVRFFYDSTKLGLRVCREIINTLWGCSPSTSFGNNIFNLLESSANEDNNILFTPIVKKGCNPYIKYLDEQAGAFALYKIRQYKPNKL